MQIRDLMTPNPATVQPGHTIQHAARTMDELNVGVLPVTEDGKLVGMLTDRDIVVRSASTGQDPKTARVADAMTLDPLSLGPDAPVREAIRLMEEHQLRRLPILDGGRLVGIVSLADFAAAGTPEAGDALETISTPAEPDR
ncbi:MAG: CBS domain-containing protein [Acetobacteraceae bacterium]|nr:CBS domain-containing protein [Acetobacteraceae bacterium]